MALFLGIGILVFGGFLKYVTIFFHPEPWGKRIPILTFVYFSDALSAPLLAEWRANREALERPEHNLHILFVLQKELSISCPGLWLYWGTATQRRRASFPRRRGNLACQRPSHEKCRGNTKKNRCSNRGGTPQLVPLGSSPRPVRHRLWLHWRVRSAGEAGPCWCRSNKDIGSRDIDAIIS